ncbi:hypothetical protein [Faecalimicrobium dakarense]|uniref:hypothetical protein n=1 Tax=Faecalimicrobium dakarense TaxID=1301100 RepID=UPI0004B45067|nr:hypothetical protein [[Clostridium] dakarense]
MKFDYNFEIENILNHIYKYKIYNIAHKNNIINVNEENLADYINIFKNTKIYLGSDMDKFIINLLPKDKDGYFFRCAIAKHHNYSFPRLYDYTGNKLKNVNYNKFAFQLWEAHMNEMLLEDINRRFSQDSFIEFIDNNLNNMLDSIVLYVKNLNKDNEIIIPLKNEEDLIPTIKTMLLNKELDLSFAQIVVDMDALRDEMTKFTTAFHIYSEFDKLEDNLQYCLDNFFKYDSKELYNLLTTEKGFSFVNDIGLVLK